MREKQPDCDFCQAYEKDASLKDLKRSLSWLEHRCVCGEVRGDHRGGHPHDLVNRGDDLLGEPPECASFRQAYDLDTVLADLRAIHSDTALRQ